jgi:hypothetical protein
MDLDVPVLPAYGTRSLAELAPALLAALGADARSAGAPPDTDGLDRLGIGPAGRICLLLVDGLGADQLALYASDAPFLSSLTGREPLTAGFPSSTPVSLSTLGTGAPPGAHGIVGVHFEASPGELLESIKWTIHRGGRAVDQREELPPEQVQPLDTLLHRAATSGVDVRVVSARAFEGSGLTRAALRGGQYRGVHALGDLAAELITALHAPAPVFCYGYHAHLDMLGHVYGPGSLPWRLELSVIDRVAGLVAEALPPDGLLVVTADHGMVTVPAGSRIDADTDPALRAGVRLLGGDPRSRHVYAKPGAAAEVLAAWKERLGPAGWVRAGEEAIEAGWFGPTVDDRTRARIGDVVVAMRGDSTVTRSRAEPMISLMIGQHGSLTPAEQHIPLLLARAR